MNGRPTTGTFDETVNILYTLISFECLDILAGPSRSIEEVVPVVQRLAQAARHSVWTKDNCQEYRGH